KAKANEIADDVKTYLDHAGPRSNAIEDSLIASNALEKVKQELGEVWKDSQLLTAVGKEFEVMNGRTFTFLPEVTISADAGQVREMEFSPSVWDRRGSGHGLRVQEEKRDGHLL